MSITMNEENGDILWLWKISKSSGSKNTDGVQKIASYSATDCRFFSKLFFSASSDPSVKGPLSRKYIDRNP